jgi:GTPase Era involved in 16S rRNA processing
MTQMEDLFMVCVVGEFNAGKSKFVNALLGDRSGAPDPQLQLS